MRRPDPRRVDPARPVPQARQPGRDRRRGQAADRGRRGAGQRRGRDPPRPPAGAWATSSPWPASPPGSPTSPPPTTCPGESADPPERSDGSARQLRTGQLTPSRSTTKIRVSPGLIDAAGAAVAVPEVRRDHELAAAADLHALHALVPAGDDLADAEPELQRRAAVVRRVELLAGRVGDADVVHRDGRAGGGLGAVALGDLGDDEVGRAARGRGSRSRACPWPPTLMTNAVAGACRVRATMRW